MLGLENVTGGSRDNFRRAEIVNDSKNFDAAQYSFFGDAPTNQGLDAGLDLDGALEDELEPGGLEEDTGLDLDDAEDEEDLSLAAIFVAQGQLNDSPVAPDNHHVPGNSFQPDHDVVSTPVRARQPSSPSLRLTPGAPPSSMRHESHVSAMQPPLQPSLQLHQSAFTPPPGPSSSLSQLLNRSMQQTPQASPAGGQIRGPVSVADLEAQMLRQTQSPGPSPMPSLMMDPSARMPFPHHSNSNTFSPAMHHVMHPVPGPGHLSPYPNMQQLPGTGPLSPFPGQSQQQQQHGSGHPSPFPDLSPYQNHPSPMQASPYRPGLSYQQSPGNMHGQGMQGMPTPPGPPGQMHSGQHPPHLSTNLGMAPLPPPQPSYLMSPPPRPKGSPAPYYHPGMGPPTPQHPHQHQSPAPTFAVRPHRAQGQQSPGMHYQAAPPPPPLPPGGMHMQQGSPHPGLHHQGQGGPRSASPMQRPRHVGGAGTGSHFGGALPRRGVFMSADEVDSIMRIMFAAVHAGHPYTEDYYYQAFTNAHCSGVNDAAFEPQALRDLSEGVARLDPTASVSFVPIEGLGKMVYSNLRTPRVLLDFGSTGEAGHAAEGGNAAHGTEAAAATAPLRPLEHEPLLAARIMIEDCLNLLLDVDDIDRRFKAAMTRAANRPGSGTAPLPDNAAELIQRRALLLAGIVSSFRLPRTPSGGQSPTCPEPAPEQPSVGDLVFRRVMVLPKGRKLLARTLLVLSPKVLPSSLGVSPVPGLDPLQLLWAALRNAAWLFGSSFASPDSADRALIGATTLVAVSAQAAVGMLHHAGEVLGCLEALLVGLQPVGGGSGAGPIGVLPLVRTRRAEEESAARTDWLGDVVVKLMHKADEFGLEAGAKEAGSTAAEKERWQAGVAALVTALTAHLEALKTVHVAATAAGNADALAMLAALAARPVIKAVAHFTTYEVGTKLQTLAGELSGNS